MIKIIIVEKPSDDKKYPWIGKNHAYGYLVLFTGKKKDGRNGSDGIILAYDEKHRINPNHGPVGKHLTDYWNEDSFSRFDGTVKIVAE